MTVKQHRQRKRVAIYTGPAIGRIHPGNPWPDIFESERFVYRKTSWDVEDITRFYDTSATGRTNRDFLCEEVQAGKFTDVICFTADRIGDEAAVDLFRSELREHGVKLHFVQRNAQRAGAKADTVPPQASATPPLDPQPVSHETDAAPVVPPVTTHSTS
jgi:hypothetical protein